MPLTAPSRFTDNQHRHDATCGYIVKITVSSIDYYFGTSAMQISEGYVHALITKIKVAQKDNFMEKRWSRVKTEVALSNVPYAFDTSGNLFRASDKLSASKGSVVVVYAFTSPVVSAVADCVIVFTGVVDRLGAYNETSVVVSCIDTNTLLSTKLPQNVVSGTYSDAPALSINQRIPLVYGKFTLFGGENLVGGGDEVDHFDYTGTGLAVALPADVDQPQTMVVSDHILNAFTKIWVKEDQMRHPSEYDLDATTRHGALGTDPVFTIDDSGRGTCTIGSHLNGYLEPLAEGDSEDQYDTDYTPPTNASNVWDLDDTNFADVLDNVDPGGGSTAIADGFGTFQASEDFLQTLGQSRLVGFWADYKTFKPAGYTATSYLITMYFNTADSDGSSNFSTMTMDKVWRRTTNASAVQLAFSLYDGHLLLGFRLNTTVSGDGTDDNQTMLEVYGYRLMLVYKTEADVKQPAFAECEGRKYSAWISSRSSNYSSGDVIEDPAGMIESLLRDELGLVTADIDEASFIESENTIMKLKLNLHSGNLRTTEEIIKEIVFQSTFTFTYGADEKVRLIDMDVTSPSVDRVFTYNQIIQDSLKISSTRKIINTVEIEYGEQQEYGRFMATTSNTNAGSVTTYGTFTKDDVWGLVTSSAVADELIDHLYEGASNSLYEQEHAIITFKVSQTHAADVSIGDWIQLDPATFDPHIRIGETSWSEYEFCIESYQKTDQETTIIAMAFHLGVT